MKTAVEEINEMFQGPWELDNFTGLNSCSIADYEHKRLLELAAELDEARKSLGANNSQRLFSKG